jgi:hypothetical protein
VSENNKKIEELNSSIQTKDEIIKQLEKKETAVSIKKRTGGLEIGIENDKAVFSGIHYHILDGLFVGVHGSINSSPNASSFLKSYGVSIGLEF